MRLNKNRFCGLFFLWLSIFVLFIYPKGLPWDEWLTITLLGFLGMLFLSMEKEKNEEMSKHFDEVKIVSDQTQFLEKIKKHAWNGVAIINFCGRCMKPLLNEEQVKEIGLEIMKNNMELTLTQRASQLLERIPEIGTFMIFVPGNEEQAQLVNHKRVYYPICINCVKHINEPDFFDKITENIVHSRIDVSYSTTEVGSFQRLE